VLTEASIADRAERPSIGGLKAMGSRGGAENAEKTENLLYSAISASPRETSDAKHVAD